MTAPDPTIRVTVEVPELSDAQIAALRAANRGRPWRPLCDAKEERTLVLLRLIDRTGLTPLGRAVLEHYEGGR